MAKAANPPGRRRHALRGRHGQSQRARPGRGEALLQLETREEVAARGVEFPDPAVKQFWVWWATFKDNEGNLYGLGQRGTAGRGED
jgi:hypothetical protein